MYKALKTLIRLNKFKLDQIILKINNFEKTKKQILAEKTNLLSQRDIEIEKYSASEYSFMLDEYLQTVSKKLKIFDLEIEKYDKFIADYQIKLQAQYSELKQYEIAQDNKTKKDKSLEVIKENKLIDEINISKKTE